MKSLASLLAEIFEHPFSGPDHYKEPSGVWKKPNEISDLQGNLKDHYKPVEDHDPGHREHIHAYVHSSSALNKHLLSWPLEDEHGEHADRIRHLDEAVKAHRTPEDFHVYSGLGFHPEHKMYRSSDDKPYMNLHMPAYTSTSIDHTVASRFTSRRVNSPYFYPKNPSVVDRFQHKDHGHILKIHVPQGSHGLFIHGYDKEWPQKEFVLPRDSKLHIHKTPTIGQIKWRAEPENVHVWHAKLVHDGVEDTRHMSEFK
jgi:hypothetical protein